MGEINPGKPDVWTGFSAADEERRADAAGIGRSSDGIIKQDKHRLYIGMNYDMIKTVYYI